MRPSIHEAIVGELRQRGIGYVVTDQDLTIIATYGDSHIFGECDPASVGLPLLEVAPELIGNESVLITILAGATERLQFDIVNRDLEDGRNIYVRITVLPYSNEIGDNVGLIYFLENITETAIQQQRLLQNRNELEILQQEKSQLGSRLKSERGNLSRSKGFIRSFLSVATHQMGEPLTAVDGFLSLLREKSQPASGEPADLYEVRLGEAVEQLKHAAGSLLEILTIEVNDVPHSPRLVELAELVEEASAYINLDLHRKHIDLVVNVEDGMPKVFCDEEQTVQIIRRLFTIAVDCQDEDGTIFVSLRAGDLERSVMLVIECHNKVVTTETLKRVAVLSKDLNNIHIGNRQLNALDLYVLYSLVKLQKGEMQILDTDQTTGALAITLPIAEPN